MKNTRKPANPKSLHKEKVSLREENHAKLTEITDMNVAPSNSDITGTCICKTVINLTYRIDRN